MHSGAWKWRALASDSATAQPRVSRSSSPAGSAVSVVVDQYCADCHDRDMKKGGIDLVSIISEDVAQHPELWEKVIRKLRARQMPPAGKSGPDERTCDAVVSTLEVALDRASAKHPNPGRTETFRRLNRREYQNAIRDLLALDIDAAVLLPTASSSSGNWWSMAPT